MVEHRIKPGITYLDVCYHRDRTPGKSQWTISLEQEYTCFTLTHDNDWILEFAGYGLHIHDGQAHYLGEDRDHSTKVFMAKFQDGNMNGKWHGWPVDHRRDRPFESILLDWKKQGFFSPAKIIKIIRGKPCSL